MKTNSPVSFAFFGTPHLSVCVLQELELVGLLPSVLITTPDKPQGRGLVMTPSPVKIWAEALSIPVLEPITIDEDFVQELQSYKVDTFVVVAYGKILPAALLTIPINGTLNIHPSLLPRWRGPSPVRAGILADDRAVGVSVMMIDEKMDHGPIIEQVKVEVSEWPPHASELEEQLIREGGKILARILPQLPLPASHLHPQDDTVATYCKKIKKEDGLIDLNADAYQNLLKIRAYEGWPGTYTFIEKNGEQVRIKILSAEIRDNKLELLEIIPEGKKIMSYREFLSR